MLFDTDWKRKKMLISILAFHNRPQIVNISLAQYYINPKYEVIASKQASKYQDNFSLA